MTEYRKSIINEFHRRQSSERGVPESDDAFEADIVVLCKRGFTQTEIAEMHGVTQGCISKRLQRAGVVTKRGRRSH